jgi:ATPase subunit of ABC transporter with duplicated ATPase domains
MIQINQLTMSYGQKLLFFDVNLIFSDRKHYALVGANGAGKSTLLKLITGEEEPLSGSVSIPKDSTIGWLKQDQFQHENTLITDIVLQGKPKLWKALQEKEKILKSAESDWNDEIAHQLSHCEEMIAAQDGYSAMSLAEKLLIGLGIHPEYHQKPLSSLSGGFKLRVLFAQALFQEPETLLLDEPTNHLDIIAINWLEKYLKNEFKGTIIFISHDVAFIDKLADTILDIDYGEVRQYAGNYEKFLIEKKLVEEQKHKELKSAEKKIDDMQKFVDRFRAGTRSTLAQSRLKRLEKMELPDIKQTSRVAPHFHFVSKRHSGKLALRVKALSKEFESKKLFSHLTFDASRGEKIAIIGENGIGKSTLIKILLDKIAPSEGSFEWGYETHTSYFSQDHHDLLNKHMTVLEWLKGMVTSTTEQNIRKTLGQMLFKQDDVYKDILAISGGEAARLLLAKIILEAGNVLVLDEPTNHLDIETTDSLAKALHSYHGTLIFVSHDRHFISKVANRILFVSHGKKMIDFKGTYAEFVEKYQG